MTYVGLDEYLKNLKPQFDMRLIDEYLKSVAAVNRHNLSEKGLPNTSAGPAQRAGDGKEDAPKSSEKDNPK